MTGFERIPSAKYLVHAIIQLWVNEERTKSAIIITCSISLSTGPVRLRSEAILSVAEDLRTLLPPQPGDESNQQAPFPNLSFQPPSTITSTDSVYRTPRWRTPAAPNPEAYILLIEGKRSGVDEDRRTGNRRRWHWNQRSSIWTVDDRCPAIASLLRWDRGRRGENVKKNLIRTLHHYHFHYQVHSFMFFPFLFLFLFLFCLGERVCGQ